MTKLLGISGSLRKASFNTALLKAAQAVAPDGVEFETATLHGIPLYDGDVEAESGVPAAAEALKQKIVAADGVILFTPEYNNSVPGVFQECNRLAEPPASRHKEGLRRAAVRARRRISGKLRDHSQPKRLAVGDADARRRNVVGQAADGAESQHVVRQRRTTEGRSDPGEAARLRTGLRRSPGNEELT